MAKPWRGGFGLHRWQRLRGATGQWYRECWGCGKQRINVYKVVAVESLFTGARSPAVSPAGVVLAI